MQIKYLSAWLDQNMIFKTHVTKQCQSAVLSFLRIRSIRQFLTCTKKAFEALVVGTVLSHLDNANSLLIGSPKCTTQPMQLTVKPFIFTCPLYSLVLRLPHYHEFKGPLIFHIHINIAFILTSRSK